MRPVDGVDSFGKNGRSGYAHRFGLLSGLAGLRPRRTCENRVRTSANAKTSENTAGAQLSPRRISISMTTEKSRCRKFNSAPGHSENQAATVPRRFCADSRRPSEHELASGRVVSAAPRGGRREVRTPVRDRGAASLDRRLGVRRLLAGAEQVKVAEEVGFTHVFSSSITSSFRTSPDGDSAGAVLARLAIRPRRRLSFELGVAAGSGVCRPPPRRSCPDARRGMGGRMVR